MSERFTFDGIVVDPVGKALSEVENLLRYIAVREVAADGMVPDSLMGIAETMEDAAALLTGWQSGFIDGVYLPLRHYKSRRTLRVIRDEYGKQYWQPGDPEGY